MNIDQFAVTHHARVRKDECGEPIINGKLWKSQPKPSGIVSAAVFMRTGTGDSESADVRTTARKWIKENFDGLRFHD